MLISVRRVLEGGAAGLCLVLATQVSLAQDTPAEVVLDEIVARINQDVITKTDLDEDLQRLKIDLQDDAGSPDELEALFERRKKRRLREMIEMRLLLQKAEELGIDADAIDADVDQYLQGLMDQSGIPNAQVLDQALQQRGSNLQEYRKVIQDRMIVDGLKQQSVYGRIIVLTPDIEAYYQDHQQDYTLPPEVRLSEIALLSENKSPQVVRSKAEEVLAKLGAGESFEDLAKEYSEGASAQRGGDIGIFKVATLSEKMAKIAFSLEDGQHSGIIDNDWGLQIIKVTQKVEARVRPMEEVHQDIVQNIYAEKAQPEMDAFLEELILQSYIFVSDKYRQLFELSSF